MKYTERSFDCASSTGARDATAADLAIVGQYTVAGGAIKGIKTLEIEEPTWFQTYIAKQRDADLLTYTESSVTLLRKERGRKRRPRTGEIRAFIALT